MRNRKKEKPLYVNGKLVVCTTIAGLGDIVGKSRMTLLRYEAQGTIPPAPIQCGNYRYYPLALAKRIKPLIEKLPTNAKPPADLVAQITQMFNEEKLKLCQNQ